ncbi:methyl-accepting chemotaxis protein [Paenibacillus sp. YN15]|uniref:methyl-accepting chemotaxis protein n=1 Tax=Paenibacillus sp. YN15 TaxID=1742774 RepID=UPI0015ECC711|nr:methyl-accepting chemotaxis protein [Paenibacillus sp. YN15]
MRLTLKLRLGIGFAAIIAVFVVAAVINSGQIGRIRANMETQDSKVLLQMQALELKGAAQDIKDIASGLMISRTQAFIDKYKEARPVFLEQARQLGDTASTEEQMKWRSQLVMATNDYLNMFDQAVAIISDPNLRDVEKQMNTQHLYEETQKQRDKIFTLTDQFYAAFSQDAEAAMAVSRETLDQSASSMWLYSLLAIALGATVAIVIILYFGRSIRRLQNAVSVIAEGNLSHKINSASQDELGQLSRAFDTMVDKVRDMVVETKAAATSLDEHSGQFQRYSQDTAAANAHILTAIQDIAKGAGQQAQQAEDSAGILDQLEREIGDIWEYARMMSQSGKTSEQNTKNGQASIEALQKASMQTEELLMEVQQSMAGLSQHSSKIGAIVETIGEIASQTNILSLNAAIEAARAGTYGKGFSVIAEEVRVLSLHTSEQSRNIEQIIGGLSGEIAALGDKLSESQQMILKQNSQVVNCLGSFTAIAGSAAEVSSRMEQVNGKVDTIRMKCRELVESFQQVAAVAQETAAGVQEVNSTSLQQDAAIRHVAGQAEDIHRLSKELFRLLQSFVVA